MGFIAGFLDLLFPPRCAFCKRVLGAGENGMCKRCDKTIARTRGGGARTGDFYDLCVSPLYYEDRVRAAVLRFKFQDATAYAELFGRLIADCVTAHLAGRYDLITWVPLSRNRLKKRGYDQAMLLAMAAALQLDDVAVELLKKPEEVPAQSGVGSAERRRANISGAFSVADAELVSGRRILLIDDIVTTGATLSECAKTLRAAGATAVVCCTLARTRE